MITGSDSPSDRPRNDYKKKYLLRLRKRRDFLAERTKDNPNLSYDLAELQALSWAIDTLAGIYNMDEQFNYR